MWSMASDGRVDSATHAGTLAALAFAGCSGTGVLPGQPETAEVEFALSGSPQSWAQSGSPIYVVGYVDGAEPGEPSSYAWEISPEDVSGNVATVEVPYGKDYIIVPATAIQDNGDAYVVSAPGGLVEAHAQKVGSALDIQFREAGELGQSDYEALAFALADVTRASEAGGIDLDAVKAASDAALARSRK